MELLAIVGGLYLFISTLLGNGYADTSVGDSVIKVLLSLVLIAGGVFHLFYK